MTYKELVKQVGRLRYKKGGKKELLDIISAAYTAGWEQGAVEANMMHNGLPSQQLPMCMADAGYAPEFEFNNETIPEDGQEEE